MGDDNPELELGGLYYHVIKPDDDRWRELMLDLGAPLATNWWLSSRVEINHSRQDLPFDVSEIVSIRDEGGWNDLSKNEIARVNPAHRIRLRIFLYDRMPRLNDVPVVSDRLPSKPFLEIKVVDNEVRFLETSLRIEMLHSSVMATEGAKYLRWWAATIGSNEQQSGALLVRAKVGRPRKFRSKEDYITALNLAASEIERKGQAVTQEQIAEWLSDTTGNGMKRIDVRQIRKWCGQFEVDWQEWKQQRKGKAD